MCFLLLLAAHLLGAPGGAETDSTKKYALNDPRNPNCPCHQYQQQADREYAKVLQAAGENKGQVELNAKKISGQKAGKRTRNWRRTRHGDKNHKTKIAKRKCFRDRLSRCFHF